MKIHIVHFDYALDWESDHDTLGIFRKREDAVACLKAKADEIRGEWDEDEIEEDSDTRFCAYEIGCYNENHHSLWIEDYELK